MPQRKGEKRCGMSVRRDKKSESFGLGNDVCAGKKKKGVASLFRVLRGAHPHQNNGVEYFTHFTLLRPSCSLPV